MHDARPTRRGRDRHSGPVATARGRRPQPRGLRMYTEAEVRRLALVRRMRPLGFSLEDVRAVLEILERLGDGGGPVPETDAEAHEELVARLRG
ncbi:MerR family transcriptional regulator [Streptomyces sp. MAR4 CNY-716]